MEVLPVRLFREVKPFVIWLYHPLLYYDVFLYDLVDLVVLFKTSPRSSKSESGWKSYDHFSFVVSASFRGGGLSGPNPKYLAQISGSVQNAVHRAQSLRRSNYPTQIPNIRPCLERHAPRIEFKGGGGIIRPKSQISGLGGPNSHNSLGSYK